MGSCAMPSVMDITEYQTKEAKRLGMSLKDFRQFFTVTPCKCGKKKCRGWSVKWKFGSKRRAEGNW